MTCTPECKLSNFRRNPYQFEIFFFLAKNDGIQVVIKKKIKYGKKCVYVNMLISHSHMCLNTLYQRLQDDKVTLEILLD